MHQDWRLRTETAREAQAALNRRMTGQQRCKQPPKNTEVVVGSRAKTEKKQEAGHTSALRGHSEHAHAHEAYMGWARAANGRENTVERSGVKNVGRRGQRRLRWMEKPPRGARLGGKRERNKNQEG